MATEQGTRIFRVPPLDLHRYAGRGDELAEAIIRLYDLVSAMPEREQVRHFSMCITRYQHSESTYHIVYVAFHCLHTLSERIGTGEKERQAKRDWQNAGMRGRVWRGVRVSVNELASKHDRLLARYEWLVRKQENLIKLILLLARRHTSIEQLSPERAEQFLEQGASLALSPEWNRDFELIYAQLLKSLGQMDDWDAEIRSIGELWQRSTTAEVPLELRRPVAPSGTSSQVPAEATSPSIETQGAELEQVKAELEQVKKEREQAQAALEQARAELAQALSRAQGAESARQAAQNQATAAQAERDTAQAERDAAQAERDAAEIKTQPALDAAIDRAEQAEEDLEGLRAEMKKLKAELRRLHALLATEAAVAVADEDLESKYALLRAERNARGEAEGEPENAAPTTRDAARLKTRTGILPPDPTHRELQHALEALAKAHAAHQALHRSHQTEQSRAQAAAEALEVERARHQKLAQERRAMEARVATLEQALTASSTSHAEERVEWHKRLEDAKTEAAKATAQLAQLQAHIHTLNEQLSSSHQQQERMVALAGRVEKAETEARMLRSALPELEAEVAGLKQRMAADAQKLSAAEQVRTQLGVLRDQLDGLAQEHTTVQHEYEAAQQALSVAARERVEAERAHAETQRALVAALEEAQQAHLNTQTQAAEIATLQSQKSADAVRIGQLEAAQDKEKGQLQREMLQRNEVVENLAKELAALDHELQDLSGTLSEREREVLRLHEEVKLLTREREEWLASVEPQPSPSQESLSLQPELREEFGRAVRTARYAWRLERLLREMNELLPSLETVADSSLRSSILRELSSALQEALSSKELHKLSDEAMLSSIETSLGQQSPEKP